ncbi:MAG: alpha/beta fold hydrolase [Candidatus Binatia bacterium]
MTTLGVNGIEVYYEIHGSGEPVMLITGLGGIGESWGPQIQLFARDFRTIVPDHRGAGRTSFPEHGYNIGQLASDMAELLRALKTGPTHVIGSSTGGAIAQAMCLDHPDVVRSAVLVSTWGKTDAYFRHCFEFRKRILKELGIAAYWEASTAFLWSPRHVREHYDDLLREKETTIARPSYVEIMIKRIDMILAHDELTRLVEIRKPTLVIVGKEDVCTPPYFSEELAHAIPGAELAILERGHFFYKEDPEPFHRHVREFLLRH